SRSLEHCTQSSIVRFDSKLNRVGLAVASPRQRTCSAMKMTAADAIVECLLAEGICNVFTLSGTEILPILDVVDRNPKMRLVLTRHEQGASLMALGYATASRGPAVCMATVGPGAINLMAGVAAAHKSHTPLIAITGIQDRWLHQRDGHKDLEQVAFYAPITKW